MKIKTSTVLLILILLIAAFLRFWGYNNFSLTNDELSALSRVQYNNFSELISFGVRPDGHPALVQVFLYYWVKAFGDSEASLRFPFVIAGILSILIAFLVAKKWFGPESALFVAVSLAFLEFPLLYSRLARPYSFGLLFTLMFIMALTNITINNKIKLKNILFTSLTAALCMYTHYFAFLIVVLGFCTAIFFVNKKNLHKYIYSIILTIILFLPHLKITLDQLHLKGLQWLQKPDNHFFTAYLMYLFNNSKSLLIIIIFLFTFSIIYKFSETKFSRYHLLCILLFLLPYFIGYYYSIYRAPVLLFSCLLFSFPFLYFFIFSFFNKFKANTVFYILLIFFLIFGVYNSVVTKKFYTKQHFAEFKKLAVYTKNWNNKYLQKNITSIININSPFYINYYFKKIHYNYKFKKYIIRSVEDIKEIYEIVERSSTPFFLYAGACCSFVPEINEIIREKYNRIVEQRNFFNSFIHLYTSDKEYKRALLFYSVNDFEQEYQYWSLNRNVSDTLNVYSGNRSCRLDSNNIYSAVFKIPYNRIKENCGDTNIISISCYAYLLDTNTRASLVFSCEDINAKVRYWRGRDIRAFVPRAYVWNKVFLTIKNKSMLSKDDIIKVYVWNPGKQELYIDNITIKIYEYDINEVYIPRYPEF